MWADRRGARPSCTSLVEADAGVVARRAELFTTPPLVWEVDGTALRPADAAPPAAVPPAAPPAPALAELLVDADIEVVVEDGIVRGEVLGLEVARIVHGTTTAGTPIDEPVLEVGVGHADRELTGDAPRQPARRPPSSPGSSRSSAPSAGSAPSATR